MAQGWKDSAGDGVSPTSGARTQLARALGLGALIVGVLMLLGGAVSIVEGCSRNIGGSRDVAEAEERSRILHPSQTQRQDEARKLASAQGVRRDGQDESLIGVVLFAMGGVFLYFGGRLRGWRNPARTSTP